MFVVVVVMCVMITLESKQGADMTRSSRGCERPRRAVSRSHPPLRRRHRPSMRVFVYTFPARVRSRLLPLPVALQRATRDITQARHLEQRFLRLDVGDGGVRERRQLLDGAHAEPLERGDRTRAHTFQTTDRRRRPPGSAGRGRVRSRRQSRIRSATRRRRSSQRASPRRGVVPVGDAHAHASSTNGDASGRARPRGRPGPRRPRRRSPRHARRARFRL